MKPLSPRFPRSFSRIGLRLGATLAATMTTTAACAATSDGMFGSFISLGCSILTPLVGTNSKVVSLVFVLVLAVMIFLWWLNENKEGLLLWLLRTGVAVGVLINIFTLPAALGMAPVCT